MSGGVIGQQPHTARAMEFALWALGIRGVIQIAAIRERFGVSEATAFRLRSEFLRVLRQVGAPA